MINMANTRMMVTFREWGALHVPDCFPPVVTSNAMATWVGKYRHSHNISHLSPSMSRNLEIAGWGSIYLAATWVGTHSRHALRPCGPDIFGKR
eukprot:COSAG01_NODE_1182_length_11347_cov_7.504356_13_plen_93_part_00